MSLDTMEGDQHKMREALELVNEIYDNFLQMRYFDARYERRNRREQKP